MLRLPLFLALAGVSAACSHDNCYRGLARYPLTASQFCSTYTTSTNTAISDVPVGFAAPCSNLPSRVSSACSCIVTRAPTTPPSTITTSSSPTACITDNCLAAMESYPTTAAVFCSSYTETIVTAPDAAPSLFASACEGSTAQISSACSCLPKPKVTCSPQGLKDGDFSSQLAGSSVPYWTVTLEQSPAAGQTVTPEWAFRAASPNFFEVDFPDTQADPFLSTVSLSQSSLDICNGNISISYQYVTTINSDGGAGQPRQNNCTLTSGLSGIPDSVLVTPLPWDTEAQGSSEWVTVAYKLFTLSLPEDGTYAAFYLDFSCLLDDYWPEIMVANLAVVNVPV